MIDTESKPGTEISVEDGDLLICITDGYGKMSIVRYPIPAGKLVWEGRNREIVGGDIHIRISSYDTAWMSINNRLTLTCLTRDQVMSLAEAMLGGPLPDAPHQCSVAGCDHGLVK